MGLQAALREEGRIRQAADINANAHVSAPSPAPRPRRRKPPGHAQPNSGLAAGQSGPRGGPAPRGLRTGPGGTGPNSPVPRPIRGLTHLGI